MLARWLKSACGIGAVVFLTACSQAPDKTDNLILGQAMPAVELVKLSGERVPLQHYQGKLVVLNFWATWCGPCREEMPHLQELSDYLDPQRFAVLGVSIDDNDHIVREFLLERNVQFADFIDVGEQVATQQLGLKLFPYTLIISPEGTLIQRFVGARLWNHPELMAAIERAYDGDTEGLFPE